MKKIFTFACASSLALSVSAFNLATEGETYWGSQCAAIGLADGTVAIHTYYLAEGEDTEVTLPSTIQVWEGDVMTAEYEVSQIGSGSAALWVSDLSENNALATITTITVAEGVKSIAQSCFGWTATSLQTISLPSTLSSIGAGAFAACDALTTIRCAAAAAPILALSTDEWAWTDHFKGGAAWDCIVNQCKVKVPETAIESYNQDPWTYWTAFYSAGNVEADDTATLQSITSADAQQPAYDLQGRPYVRLQRGLQIVGGRKCIIE